MIIFLFCEGKYLVIYNERNGFIIIIIILSKGGGRVEDNKYFLLCICLS